MRLTFMLIVFFLLSIFMSTAVAVGQDFNQLLKAVDKVEDNLKRQLTAEQQIAEKGVSAAEETAKSITDIAGSSEKVGALVGEIAGAIAERAQDIDQVNTAVAQKAEKPEDIIPLQEGEFQDF